jgi:hypothetical protein
VVGSSEEGELWSTKLLPPPQQLVLDLTVAGARKGHRGLAAAVGGRRRLATMLEDELHG